MDKDLGNVIIVFMILLFIAVIIGYFIYEDIIQSDFETCSEECDGLPINSQNRYECKISCQNYMINQTKLKGDEVT